MAATITVNIGDSRFETVVMIPIGRPHVPCNYEHDLTKIIATTFPVFNNTMQSTASRTLHV